MMTKEQKFASSGVFQTARDNVQCRFKHQPDERKEMYFVDRTAAVLKPTRVFLDWLNKAGGGDIPALTLEQIRSNCSVYLVPQFDTPEEVLGYFGERHRGIFEAEIAAWDIAEKDWPKDMGFQSFSDFFDIEIHDMVLDTDDEDIKISPVFNDMM